jgi:hypothetical protein
MNLILFIFVVRVILILALFSAGIVECFVGDNAPGGFGTNVDLVLIGGALVLMMRNPY